MTIILIKLKIRNRSAVSDMKPELSEVKNENGEHLNWRLVDKETNEVLWEEWSEDAIGHIVYDFKEDISIFVRNPNKVAADISEDVL